MHVKDGVHCHLILCGSPLFQWCIIFANNPQEARCLYMGRLYTVEKLRLSALQGFFSKISGNMSLSSTEKENWGCSEVNLLKFGAKILSLSSSLFLCALLLYTYYTTNILSDFNQLQSFPWSCQSCFLQCWHFPLSRLASAIAKRK